MREPQTLDLILFPRPELQAEALLPGEIELLLACLPELLLELETPPSAERVAGAL